MSTQFLCEGSVYCSSLGSFIPFGNASYPLIDRRLIWSRLPVPSLWLDVFQKIKALGYSGVSFYSDWALLEGRQGNFSAEGVFAFEPFFEAASIAGVYLLAVCCKSSNNG